MRVVGGKLGGRRFQPPSGLPARPTTDLAREALFNILNNILTWEGAETLDLFGGVGSLSYELLSRGVARVTTVEQDAASVAFIRKTAQDFGVGASLNLLRMDVFRFLKKDEHRYSFLFADPPYALPRMGDLLALMLPRLEENGLAVLEHDHRHQFEPHPHFLRARAYGDTIFSFFTQSPQEQNTPES
ncbi:MAG: RsmD family RNA methyltransferase [Bacteroidetes bacterium]|nr:RsmD family RNA methyltransferase [Bacteroidota bacterium]MBS1630557.1 RsmD family RNA methyltransferase [Bacteroidota bacterium]